MRSDAPYADTAPRVRGARCTTRADAADGAADLSGSSVVVRASGQHTRIPLRRPVRVGCDDRNASERDCRAQTGARKASGGGKERLVQAKNPSYFLGQDRKLIT